MRIKKITDRLGHRGQDLYGVIECEHCGTEEKFTGYDDDYWHNHVLPARTCKSCGKHSLEAV